MSKDLRKKNYKGARFFDLLQEVEEVEEKLGRELSRVEKKNEMMFQIFFARKQAYGEFKKALQNILLK